jgi:hypothetical protein
MRSVVTGGREWTVPCDKIGQAITGYLDAGDVGRVSQASSR